MKGIIFVSMLLIHFSAAVPIEEFYSFGLNTTDMSMVQGDDKFSELDLTTSIHFYGQDYNISYVSVRS